METRKPHWEISKELDNLSVKIDKLISDYHIKIGGGKIEIELRYMEELSGNVRFMSSNIKHTST